MQARLEYLTSPNKGYLYVILAAFLWAISGSAAKFLLSSGVTPFELVQLRLILLQIRHEFDEKAPEVIRSLKRC